MLINIELKKKKQLAEESGLWSLVAQLTAPL